MVKIDKRACLSLANTSGPHSVRSEVCFVRRGRILGYLVQKQININKTLDGQFPSFTSRGTTTRRAAPVR
ncbi:hypothetical protein J6590_043494 [Homalodisca vitripennis]|nr:hypothetical protein J6590_043494 [Homalodisca vitripennis]